MVDILATPQRYYCLASVLVVPRKGPMLSLSLTVRELCGLAIRAKKGTTKVERRCEGSG